MTLRTPITGKTSSMRCNGLPPEEKTGTLQNWAVQLNQLRNTIKEGDITVTPLKTAGQIAIERVINGYVHADGKHPARQVSWLRKDLPRDAIRQGLLYSLGAAQTVCEVSRNDAVSRFKAILATGRDPGLGGVRGDDAEARAQAEIVAEEGIDLAAAARDQIERRITSHFSGHAFTELIAEILRAQGYESRVSPPGND